MKKLSILLIFLLIQINSFSQDRTVVEKDYLISVPKKWISISKEFTNQLQKEKTQELRSYIIGFSKSDSTAQELPYLIASYVEIPGSENSLFREVLEIQRDVLKEKGFNVDFKIDSINYNFYTELKIHNTITYQGYSVGGNGTLFLNYYPASNSDEERILFQKILSSVKHNKKFLNKDTLLAEKQGYEKEAGKSAMLALVGLGSLTLISFIRKKSSKD
ncbi:hypothetical protein C3K47_15130 [Solitalea longa]|uniref:Uncharacterized protein n=1 Tax=Solitalea longa TaxID=2079460 RepID=A0A2S4ZZU4_9SPHI|nr:hypothetical protein [Solitalea longa]POY35393.1 hypothetical protein C3K47_15130 [Solitalea longa]